MDEEKQTLLAIAAQVLKQLSAKEKQQLDNILLKKGVTSTKALIKTLTKAMNKTRDMKKGGNGYDRKR